MSQKQLASALGAVDWAQNVASFLADKSHAKALSNANLRIAIWALQFEHSDAGNCALPFVREMQSSSQGLAALVALGLYQSAATAMRSVVEAGLYYTYFRTHPEELATLIRDQKFYLGKREIIEYHILHTANFKQHQNLLGVISRFDGWYRKVSSIAHRQLPGSWSSHTALKDIKFESKINADVVETFVEGEEVLHRMFLCTVAKHLWPSFSPSAKKVLLKGVAGSIKGALMLDPS